MTTLGWPLFSMIKSRFIRSLFSALLAAEFQSFSMPASICLLINLSFATSLETLMNHLIMNYISLIVPLVFIHNNVRTTHQPACWSGPRAVRWATDNSPPTRWSVAKRECICRFQRDLLMHDQNWVPRYHADLLMNCSGGCRWAEWTRGCRMWMVHRGGWMDTRGAGWWKVFLLCSGIHPGLC